jgi:malic enzyme
MAVAAPTDGDSLLDTVRSRRPTFLVGATGIAGTFDEAVVRAMADSLDPTEVPTILPLSNPTSAAEATPADCLAWTGGRAIVATGSPFDPVTVGGRRVEIGQANNVFIFPGMGLGAIVSGARTVTDQMFLVAARELAAAVEPDRLAAGSLFPPISSLRDISWRIAVAVAGDSHASEVADAMWWPEYVPYAPNRAQERRRAIEA